jgi:signal transduction histidine kinase
MNQHSENISEKKQTTFGLQLKFLLGLACIFLFFCTFASGLIYFHQKKALEEETFRKTELVAAAVESTREYVRDVLRPRMYELLDEGTFVIEAMSTSYISRVVMDRFKKNLPEFEYRRVAINARNPEYEANALELKMIRLFNEKPEKTQWHGMVKTERGRLYMSFSPVRFSGPCFRCHGDPESAPHAIVESYGPLHGFHRKPNLVSGVQSVGIPVDFSLKQIMNVAWTFFFAAFLVMFFLYGIIWFFFNRVVVQNLQQLLDIFRDNLRDEKGVRLYQQARSKDEIDEMSVAVQSVARHLHETHKKLEDYAENLENKVADRTRALQNSENRLRQKVAERGLELRTLNTITELITQSVHLTEILPKVLRQTLKVVPASGAGIYFLDREQGMLRLQCRENADELDDKIPFEPALCLPMLEEQSRDFDGFINEAACTHMNQIGSEPAMLKNLNVPLCCRSQVLGVMSFIGANLEEVDAQQHELLFSIGHQIGITIESLQNITRLMQSKELLQSVFDGITDVVVLLDHDRQVKMVNQAFLDRNEVTLEQVLNHQLSKLPLKKNCPFTFCAASLSLSSRKVTVEQVRTEEGTIYEVSLYPIVSDRGTVLNIVCYAKDITEQKHVEQRIQQTEKLFALGQLAAGVAHEINNPLGVILCYADILKQDLEALSAQHCEDIEVIEKHARSCQHIVSDLLNFARSHKADKSLCCLNPVIEEVVAMVKQQFLKNRVDIILELAPDLPESLIGIDRMRQVFLNLLMNSSHAIKENGTIHISSVYHPEDRMVEVIFRDNGDGIAEDVLTKIFDPFFTTKPQGSGTGLGLSVSYGIIRDHGGDIQAKSKPGTETIFIITLPVKSNSIITDNSQQEA